MIRTDEEHAAAMARIEEIFLTTDEAEMTELNALVVDVVGYEETRWPMEEQCSNP